MSLIKSTARRMLNRLGFDVRRLPKSELQIPDAKYYRPLFSPWLGYGEFAKALRADPEPAQQNFAVFHERHGLLRYMPIGMGTVDEGTIYDGSHNMILPTVSGATA